MRYTQRGMSIADRLKFYSELRSGCLEWTGHTTAGYGRLKVKGKMEAAHRLAYEVVHGRIPSHLFVCHRCDNRRCIRPGHLFLGTHQDNMDDMAKKGRAFRMIGEEHVNHKLTAVMVRAIRRRSRKEVHAALAREYGVGEPAVSKILTGRTWRHL